MDHASATDANAAELVLVLHALQTTLENLDLRQPDRARTALETTVAARADALVARFAAAPPADAVSATLADAAREAAASVARLLERGGGDLGLTLIETRRAYCRALLRAYPLAATVPALDAFWREPDVPPRPAASVGGERGVLTHPPGGGHAGYALYVPEDYRPVAPRPLVVALHGAYGHGEDYLWTWLRAARSHGWLVLAPKSRDVTWSLLEPARDIANLRAALAEVQTGYLVDAERTWLTGLSDGGSFSYVAALSCPSLFRAVAPIAGVLHPVTDALLRAKQGQDVPLLVVHGARDPIFDVRGVRSTSALLHKLGYRVDYRELPDWAHAWTDGINERLVRPWFAALPGAALAGSQP